MINGVHMERLGGLYHINLVCDDNAAVFDQFTIG